MHRNSLISVFISLVVGLTTIGSVAAQEPQPAATVAAAVFTSPSGTPVSAAITYQGQLKQSGSPANGNFDFQFVLYDAASSGSQQGATLKVNNLAVNNGLFNVQLDFGQGVFSGEARFLEVGVKPAGSANTYTVLSPRTELSTVPYAQWATQATALSSPDGTPQNAAYVDNDGIVHVRAGGEGRLRFDNQPELWGEINRWFNRFEILAPDIISLAIGGVANEKVKVDNGGLTVNGTLRATSFAAPDGDPNNAVYIDNDGIMHIRAGGEGRLRFDNQPELWGEINRWFNRFEILAPDIISFAIGGVANEKMKVDNGGLTVNGTTRTQILQITGGSDLAELFSQADGAFVEPGTVMVIDPEHAGKLMMSTSAYDRKVAGIISGAGDVNPGLTLQQEGVLDGNLPVAIAGRVYVKAEALSSAIEPGDLLTTSDMAGYAMKASNDDLSHGAIIGKAMTGLQDGTGLVLVLVNLQ